MGIPSDAPGRGGANRGLHFEHQTLPASVPSGRTIRAQGGEVASRQRPPGAELATEARPSAYRCWRRHRKVRRAAFILFVAGVALAIVATLQGRDNSAVLLLPAFLGMAAYAGNEWFNTIGVRLSRDGGLLLTRVHPAFERALAELNRTSPTPGATSPS